MVKYWLAISNRKNWEVVKNRKIWGVSKRNRKSISNVDKGDSLSDVSSQDTDKKLLPVIITGAFEVITPMYEDHKRYFHLQKIRRRKITPLE